MRKLVALSLLVLFTVAACTPSQTGTASPSPSAVAKKTTLRLPEGAKPRTLDPGISDGGAGLEQMQNMFEALAYVDQVTGEIKPGQAEKWTISPDGLTYTFNLRSGLKWSDGQALKASDFEYAWKRATDPATKSRYAQTLWPVKGAEAFGTGKGTADVDFDPATKKLSWKVTYSGLSGPATAAHFHGPGEPGKNAGVAVAIPNAGSSPAEGSATLTDAQAADLTSGKYYVNVHTAANPGGEIRGQVTK